MAQAAPPPPRPPGTVEGSPQQQFLHLLYAAIGARVAEMIPDRRILSHPTADFEIVRLLIRKLHKWAKMMWVRCIVNSFARIDCPSGALEALCDRFGYTIHDDNSFNTYVERLRAASGMPPAADGQQPLTSPPMMAEPVGDDDPLRDLGIELPAAGEGGGGGNGGSFVTRQQRLRNAEQRAREQHAVKRRQAKLTRIVSVQDLLWALQDESSLPMPARLRANLIAYVQVECPANPTWIDNHTPAPAVVQNIARPSYLYPKAAAYSLPAPIEALAPPLSRRFAEDAEKAAATAANTLVEAAASSVGSAPGRAKRKARSRTAQLQQPPPNWYQMQQQQQQQPMPPQLVPSRPH